MISRINIVFEDLLSFEELKSRISDFQDLNEAIILNNLPIKLFFQEISSLGNIDYLLETENYYPELKGVVAKCNFALILEINWQQDKASLQYLEVLKFINSLNLKVIYIFDEASIKLINPNLVKFYTKLDVPVKHELLFTYHAVESEFGIWIHTHGLNRFSFPEVEVTYLKQGEHVNNIMASYTNALIAFANLTLYNDEQKLVFHSDQEYVASLVESKNLELKNLPFFIELDDEQILEARKYHSEFMGYLVVDKSKFMYENDNGIFDLPTTPVFYYPPEESQKLELFSKKTFDIFKKSALKKYGEHYVKASFSLKKMFESEVEFMWVDVEHFFDDHLTGRLLNQPRYVKLKQNDIVKVSLDDIIDWVIYFDDLTINPGNSFLLLEEI